jgi:predicted metalloprotease with PDZ domain
VVVIGLGEPQLGEDAAHVLLHGAFGDRTYLGVEVAATTSGGLLVTKVRPGGPAARAGIGDGELITAVNGTATPTRPAWPRCWPGWTPAGQSP